MNAPEATELTESYMPLADSIANRWGLKFPGLRDEFRSEAAFTLWRVAVAFHADEFSNPAGAFASIVRIAIRRSLSKVLYKEQRRFPASFHQSADGLDLLEIVGRPNGGDTVDLQDWIASADLNPLDDVVLRDRLEGWTQSESGARLGISRSRVGQRLARAFKKLRCSDQP